jgi:hypothetical protein
VLDRFDCGGINLSSSSSAKLPSLLSLEEEDDDDDDDDEDDDDDDDEDEELSESPPVDESSSSDDDSSLEDESDFSFIVSDGYMSSCVHALCDGRSHVSYDDEESSWSALRFTIVNTNILRSTTKVSKPNSTSYPITNYCLLKLLNIVWSRFF